MSREAVPAPAGHHLVTLPPTGLLRRGRGPAARLVHRRFRIEVRGADQVPASGPVVIAANHIGLLDGPLMAILTPRPVHAWTKVEMFVGRTGRFLTAAGQIPLRRHEVDPAAIRTAVAVLEFGGVVGVFPEGSRGAGEVTILKGGAAYLALRTGARVVPLVFLGSRPAGAGLNAVPPRGARITLTFGAAVAVEPQPWPRRREDVETVTARIASALRQTAQEAQAWSGMRLPGPIPEEDVA